MKSKNLGSSMLKATSLSLGLIIGFSSSYCFAAQKESGVKPRTSVSEKSHSTWQKIVRYFQKESVQAATVVCSMLAGTAIVGTASYFATRYLSGLKKERKEEIEKPEDEKSGSEQSDSESLKSEPETLGSESTKLESEQPDGENLKSEPETLDSESTKSESEMLDSGNPKSELEPETMKEEPEEESEEESEEEQVPESPTRKIRFNGVAYATSIDKKDGKETVTIKGKKYNVLSEKLEHNNRSYCILELKKSKKKFAIMGNNMYRVKRNSDNELELVVTRRKRKRKFIPKQLKNSKEKEVKSLEEEEEQ